MSHNNKNPRLSDNIDYMNSLEIDNTTFTNTQIHKNTDISHTN